MMGGMVNGQWRVDAAREAGTTDSGGRSTLPLFGRAMVTPNQTVANNSHSRRLWWFLCVGSRAGSGGKRKPRMRRLMQGNQQHRASESEREATSEEQHLGGTRAAWRRRITVYSWPAQAERMRQSI